MAVRRLVYVVSSAYQCPNHGHRVKGAYGAACDRSATLDPPTAHKGFGAYEEEKMEGGKEIRP